GAHTFSVTATSGDGQMTTQTVSYTVLSVATVADLSVKLNGPSSASDGSTFTETVTVTNAGPSAATSVLTGVVVPDGLTAVNTGGGTRFGSLIIWTGSSITANASTVHTVTFKVGARARGGAVIAA